MEYKDSIIPKIKIIMENDLKSKSPKTLCVEVFFKLKLEKRTVNKPKISKFKEQ